MLEISPCSQYLWFHHAPKESKRFQWNQTDSHGFIQIQADSTYLSCAESKIIGYCAPLKQKHGAKKAWCNTAWWNTTWCNKLWCNNWSKLIFIIYFVNLNYLWTTIYNPNNDCHTLMSCSFYTFYHTPCVDYIFWLKMATINSSKFDFSSFWNRLSY